VEHEELAQLPRAVEPALDVAGAARLEIVLRQRELSAG